MWEVDCYDSGLLAFTVDLQSVEVGDRFECDEVKCEIVEVLLKSDEYMTASVEIEYC